MRGRETKRSWERAGGTPSAAPETSDGSETDLLAKAQGGNAFAFEEIVKRYQRRVYATALRITRRHDVADDVAQETFIRAHASLDRFDSTRPFGPWICRIAANLAINHLRSRAAREGPLPERHSETPATGADPLQEVLGTEASRTLRQALADLPLEQRAVFTLRVFEEMPYKEIARALDINVGTVMSRLSRARERLRLALAPYLGEALRRARGGET